ncbi:MAG: DUF1570 domain-containing protein, partial [Planctomycetota bacterium]
DPRPSRTRRRKTRTKHDLKAARPLQAESLRDKPSDESLAETVAGVAYASLPFCRKRGSARLAPFIATCPGSLVLRVGIALLLITFTAGCASVRAVPTLPEELSVARDQLIVYSDFKLASRHRLVEELVALRGDISEQLDVPVSDEPIHIYLFSKSESYQEYIANHFPGLPNRRAFFVESDTRLTVYAQWGDRVAEDLRHEVTHGYLHSVIPNTPLWLDEGIAEYFETPRGWNGLHAAHLKLLDSQASKGDWKPDLSRLDKLVTIDQMTQREYAESWLWVHFLLQTTRERRLLLQRHLHVLHEKAQAPPFSQAIFNAEPDAAYDVLDHLRMLAAENRVE